MEIDGCKMLIPCNNVMKEGEEYVMSGGVPYLHFRRFGDTSAWPLDRLNESMAFLKLKLQGQLNLYRLEMNPFADVPAKKVPRVV